MFRIIAIGLFGLLLVSCEGKTKKADPVEIVQPDDSRNSTSSKATNKKDRAAWQKPDFVISKLGDLEGKTVADIGAGLGYFTFRLAFKADKVIGIDIDPEMIETLDVLKNNLPENIQNKIEARLAKPENPMLLPEEADYAIIVNTIAYIENRVDYLSNLKDGLKNNGKLMIMDFKMKNLSEEIAPPIENRVNLYVIENELKEAGYNRIVSDDTSLEYQYIVFAYK